MVINVLTNAITEIPDTAANMVKTKISDKISQFVSLYDW